MWGWAQVTPFWACYYSYYFCNSCSPLVRPSWTERCDQTLRHEHDSPRTVWSSPSSWSFGWDSQVATSGSPVFSGSFSSFLFWHSSLRELICLVVSGCEHALKASERIHAACQGDDCDYKKKDNSQCLECTLKPCSPTPKPKSGKSEKDSAKGVTL